MLFTRTTVLTGARAGFEIQPTRMRIGVVKETYFSSILSATVKSSPHSHALRTMVLNPQSSDSTLTNKEELFIYLKRICAFIVGATSYYFGRRGPVLSR